MWEAVASITQKHRVEVKIVLIDYEPEGWSSWFILPSVGYGEVENYGPFRFKDLKELVVNPVESRRIGARVPNELIDHSESLVREFTKCGVPFERRGNVIVIQNIVPTT